MEKPRRRVSRYAGFLPHGKPKSPPVPFGMKRRRSASPSQRTSTPSGSTRRTPPPEPFITRLHALLRHSATRYVLAALSLFIVINIASAVFIRDVTLTDGTISVRIKTTERTVAGLIEKFPFGLYDEDIILPPADTKLKNGMNIEILRSMRINIVDGGIVYETHMSSGTVRDALAHAGKTLDEGDIISPSPDTLLVEGMTIRITRVWIDRYIEQQEIPYMIHYVADNTLEKGKERTSTDGVDGVTYREIELVYHDGEQADMRIVSETVWQWPKDAVVQVGTKEPPPPVTTTNTPSTSPSNPAPSSTPSKINTTTTSKPQQPAKRVEGQTSGGTVTVSGKSYSYSKVYDGKARAYTYTGNNTASGTKPRRGVVAVDPSVIPLGTKLYIPGYGIAVAEDTGDSVIKGYSIDLFMETHDECIKWGVRNVKIYILK